jgi:response regulator RpfG family c-di-GMP phosphodiesterase
MSNKRTLSVGQCSADHGSITYTLRENFRAQVVEADTIDEALRLLAAEPFDLVLVNRVFDVDGSPGIDLVRQIKAGPHGQVPVMLVSNYEDAQNEAVEAGAVPGFGKATLGRPAMLAAVRPFLS